MKKLSELIRLNNKVETIEKIDECKHAVNNNYDGICLALRHVINKEVITDNKEVIIRLAIWLYGGVVDVYEDVKPNKGIMLIGNTGVGKTKLMQALSLILRHDELDRYFTVINSYDVVEAAQMGYDFVNYCYASASQISKRNICIDDIGAEQAKVMYFGNEILPLSMLITSRYNLWCATGIMTHFTTNLSLADLRAMYGDRIADRLYEMCNIIEYNGKSKRV
jgi:DNA replication protein DnaC